MLWDLTLGLIKNQPKLDHQADVTKFSVSAEQRQGTWCFCRWHCHIEIGGTVEYHSAGAAGRTPGTATVCAGRKMKIHLIILYWPFSSSSPTVGFGHYLRVAPLSDSFNSTLLPPVMNPRRKCFALRTHSLKIWLRALCWAALSVRCSS